MKKIKLYLSDAEWRELYNSLNALKTTMINKGWHTDEVDDLLYKVLTAKTKRIKIAG